MRRYFERQGGIKRIEIEVAFKRNEVATWEGADGMGAQRPSSADHALASRTPSCKAIGH